ncbi:MAG: fluoride efflux transporter CrcB [Bacteroidota bacterium]
MAFFWIFLGGGLGSMCRYQIARWSDHSQLFPLGTFIANALSCLILGWLVAIHLRTELHASHRLLLMTGFCGGFSTFSTFSMETFQLLQSGHWGIALLNVLGSLLVGLICIYLGMKIAA